MIKTALINLGVGTDRVDDDFYETPPRAVKALLLVEKFYDTVWEPSCGAGAITSVLEAAGHTVISTDLVDRGCGTSGMDFFVAAQPPGRFDIITNPPYDKLTKYLHRALDFLELQPDGAKLALLLRIGTMAAGKGKVEAFRKWRPKFYIFWKRIGMTKRGVAHDGGMVDYVWAVFEKGRQGPSTIDWI